MKVMPGHAIVNACSVAFFDQHLKTHSAALQNSLATKYPEALFESRRPQRLRSQESPLRRRLRAGFTS